MAGGNNGNEFVLTQNRKPPELPFSQTPTGEFLLDLEHIGAALAGQYTADWVIQATGLPQGFHEPLDVLYTWVLFPQPSAPGWTFFTLQQVGLNPGEIIKEHPGTLFLIRTRPGEFVIKDLGTGQIIAGFSTSLNPSDFSSVDAFYSAVLAGAQASTTEVTVPPMWLRDP